LEYGILGALAQKRSLTVLSKRSLSVKRMSADLQSVDPLIEDMPTERRQTYTVILV